MKQEVAEAAMMVLGPLQRKLDSMTDTAKMAWLLGGMAVSLLGAGVTGGLAWANWQGLPDQLSAAEDSVRALRDDFEAHLSETSEPALRQLSVVSSRQDSIAEGVTRIENKVDALENLVLRGMCRQMGQPVQTCELRIYEGEGFQR